MTLAKHLRATLRVAAPLLCLASLGFAIAARAQSPVVAPHFPTNEDLRHTRGLRDPQLSPDGRLVLATVTEPTVDGAATHLWLIDREHGTNRQLTFAAAGSKRGERQGRWSADGQFVFFVARRGDNAQLFKLPMAGGEAEAFDLHIVPPVDASKAADAVDGSHDTAPAKPLPLDVSTFELSPDGAYAAIIARDPETPGEKKQNDDKADATLVDHDLHGERVYLLDLRTGKLAPVAVPPDVGRVAWAHKSDRFIAVTDPMNNMSDLGPADTTWLVTVSALSQPTRIAAMPATIESAVWSADDATIFFTAQAAADAPPGYDDLYALTVANSDIRDLSKSLRGTAASAALDEGTGVIAAVVMGTEAGYARADARAATLTPIDLGHGSVSQLATNERRTGWVYARSTGDEPTSLYYTPSLGQPATRLSAPATAGDWRAVKTSVVQWKSDGMTIEGLLFLPPDAATRRVPLVVDVHGGPAGAWTDSYSPFTQFLVGQGWAVLEPNPRGSIGYGSSFVAANKNDLGGGDYRDVMAGVDAVLARDSIDATRLALIGYSYGGEMAGFVEGKTDRFKAIVSGAPVIDQYSEYGTEDGSWYDRWYFGKPWERVQDAWRQSPLAGASHAKTPFLLLQGEGDHTDPIGQSQEMYRALRQAGVAVQLVTYPRDDHGPLAQGMYGNPSTEPWHGFDARQRVVNFIAGAFGAAPTDRATSRGAP